MIIVTLGGVLVGGLGKTRDKVWKQILCDVSRACPKCKIPEKVKNSLPRAGVTCK